MSSSSSSSTKKLRIKCIHPYGFIKCTIQMNQTIVEFKRQLIRKGIQTKVMNESVSTKDIRLSKLDCRDDPEVSERIDIARHRVVVVVVVVVAIERNVYDRDDCLSLPWGRIRSIVRSNTSHVLFLPVECVRS